MSGPEQATSPLPRTQEELETLKQIAWGEGYAVGCLAEKTLREALDRAASAFERYAKGHREKGTVEGEQKAAANDHMAYVCRAALASPSTEGWRDMAGVDRDKMPGVHLAYVVGWKEHSNAIWRRAGVALLSLHNDGPHGYSEPTINEAMRLLDMDGIDEIPSYRPLPSPPAPEQEGHAAELPEEIHKARRP